MMFINFNKLDILSEYKLTIIFSPYIKLEALNYINASKSIKKIVVAWHKEDLLKGVSDLEIYDYCKDNNIELYRNPKIHLKVFWDGDQEIILGSANVTQKGLGLVEASNHELSAHLNTVDDSTKAFLNKILNESVLITDEIYEQINSQLKNEQMMLPKIKDFDLIASTEDYFLLSQLPQSYSPEYLLAMAKSEPDDAIDKLCLEHDLKTYRITYLNDEQFLENLKNNFNTHPFIVKFKKHINEIESLHYGGVVKWIQENCKEVPIPRSFELKQDSIVNILYRWICFFDNSFEVTRPRYSEIIQIKKQSI